MAGRPVQPLRFSSFEIRPALRQVWVDGVAVPLGSRAFDLLLLLVEHRDRVVSKDEVFEKVWKDQVVEENNLSVQISALRRTLGADAIATVTGRGYRFAAEPATEALAAPRVGGNIAARQVLLLAREDELAQVLKAFDDAACVTVCGLAGVGKTALAGVAAHQLARRRAYAQGAWWVDLSVVREPSQLVRAVCETLGIEPEGRHDLLHECLGNLRHRELLLVLDNCEHIVDAAAAFVDALLAVAEKVEVLTTSQEPLRVAGERVLRLYPLSVPASADSRDAPNAGAVRLMLDRVRGAMGRAFEPTQVEFEDLVEICRQLDGIPLALEFAASRVPLLGLSGVRSRLNDKLRLLAGGLRSAPPRHRSLQAALEWSHQLLSLRSRAVLERLAVFPGGFSLIGAQLLLADLSEAEALEHLNVLVERSLLTLQPGARPRYRLLETTRAFALECLRSAQDGIDWQERLALTMGKLVLLMARERDSAWMWLEMPNARAAMSWAMAAPNHGQTAVTIATYTSVVLAAGGAMREALDNLLRVQGLLTEQTPLALAARYWHWLGRLGVEGRLPSSLCIDALQQADAMFSELGELRHRHACQRHLAEAQLRAGHPEDAERHLAQARALETEPMRPADCMRRLRVDALLAEARREFPLALRQMQSALTLAEANDVERYRLLLMADMAWTYLQMGHADAAVTAFQELLLHLDDSIQQGLARARALSGLTAAQIAAGRVDEAARGAGRSIRALQHANLLRSRCEVYAWLAAASAEARSAAFLIGAGEEFAARTETERDPISELARQRALELVGNSLPQDELLHWRNQGARADDTELLHVLNRTFGSAPAPSLKHGEPR